MRAPTPRDSSDSDSRLRPYLLGALPEEDAIALEERYFADSDLLDDVCAAEYALVDDYVGDRLDAEERARFERWYLRTEPHRRRVAVARGLRRHLLAAKPEASTATKAEDGAQADAGTQAEAGTTGAAEAAAGPAATSRVRDLPVRAEPDRGEAAGNTASMRRAGPRTAWQLGVDASRGDTTGGPAAATSWAGARTTRQSDGEADRRDAAGHAASTPWSGVRPTFGDADRGDLAVGPATSMPWAGAPAARHADVVGRAHPDARGARRRMTVWAMAAAVVLAAGLGAWHARRQAPTPGGPADASRASADASHASTDTPRASAAASAVASNQVAARPAPPDAGTVASVPRSEADATTPVRRTEERAKSARPDERSSRDARVASPRPGATLAVTLSPILLRGGGAAQIDVPAGVERLVLHLGGTPATRDAMAAEIATLEGRRVWSGKAGEASSGTVATTVVPASRLGADDYVATLFAIDAKGGERTELNRYVFRIARP